MYEVLTGHPLANYAVKAGEVCLQVTLCDLHLSALEVRFSRRGAIQIYFYLTFTKEGETSSNRCSKNVTNRLVTRL